MVNSHVKHAFHQAFNSLCTDLINHYFINHTFYQSLIIEHAHFEASISSSKHFMKDWLYPAFSIQNIHFIKYSQKFHRANIFRIYYLDKAFIISRNNNMKD